MWDYLKLAEAHCIKLSKKVNHNYKVCHTLFYAPRLKVKVTIWGHSSKDVSATTQKSTKANFIKLHRKTRHHERYAMHHSQRLKVKSFLCITKKTSEASLIRLHERVNNNEVICHNQN